MQKKKTLGRFSNENPSDVLRHLLLKGYVLQIIGQECFQCYGFKVQESF
jgi:hypothetical protein